MTPEQWAAALLSPAGTVTVFIGSMLGIWFALTALFWGVRKGLQFFRDVANADRNGYSLGEWREIRYSENFDNDYANDGWDEHPLADDYKRGDFD